MPDLLGNLRRKDHLGVRHAELDAVLNHYLYDDAEDAHQAVMKRKKTKNDRLAEHDLLPVEPEPKKRSGRKTPAVAAQDDLPFNEASA